MLALVLGAVRTRTAQVVAVLVLAALATAVAAAGPWYGYASAGRAATVDVATAPPAERVLSVRQISDTGVDPAETVDRFDAHVRGLLPLPSVDPVRGLVLSTRVGRRSGTPPIDLAFREGFCAHAQLDGRCPAAADEVAISESTAQQLGLGLGDRLFVQAVTGANPVICRVVGRYRRIDPGSSYWSNPLYTPAVGLEPAFTVLPTFVARQLGQPTITWDVSVPERLIRGDDGYDLAAVLRGANARLGADQLHLVDSIGPILDAIAADRAAIRLGVLVSLVQVLILSWFAIGLAGRYTGRDRRGDAALLKLRGSTRGAMLRLAWGQHLVPLIAGALVGLPLGYLLARVLAGPVVAAGDRRAALLLSVGAAVAVLVGGLLVLALVEALVLRLPVAALLRQVGSARGDWRAGLIDLLLLAVAVAAVYQVRTGAARGLALAAPALVALAVALLLARLLGWVADRGGGTALRTGRLRLGLTAVQVSRQPGGDRVFALVMVAVAMFATALGGWRGEHVARADRSAAELGATRVLGVQATDYTVLERAVRQADPGGEQAMAAVVDKESVPRVLTVDSSRLAAVARWRPEYGPVTALPAAVAEGSVPAELPKITGAELTVRLRYAGRAAAVFTLVLQDEGDGTAVRVRFGRLRSGEQSRTARVTGCPTGCRILRMELNSPPDRYGNLSAPRYGSEVTVLGLTQSGADPLILDPARLGDVTRWRAGTGGAAVDLAATHGTLRLAVDENNTLLAPVGFQVFAVDTTVPLPVVLAGQADPDWQFAEPSLSSFGDTAIPIRPVATASALPVLGGNGVLVDLDAARRVAGDAALAGEPQVWLAPGAGPALLARLRAAGLTITGDTGTAERSAALAAQAPAVVARFALLSGAAALLLAAAALAVSAAVDRRTRLDQLLALRRQGLPHRTAMATGVAGTVALAGAGLLGGLLAAVLAQPLARVVVPPFTDGWDMLPRPGALGVTALGWAGLIALAVLGLVGWLSVRPLVRRLRGDAR
jgi:ABC-type multidrug transport system fused ATPase/permease subunit